MGGFRRQCRRRHNLTIADGGYPGTGLVMPHCRRKGEDLPDWQESHNEFHKQARARVEYISRAPFHTGRSSSSSPLAPHAP